MDKGPVIDVFENRQTPCRICGQPVGMLSYGGPDVCSWCDSGVNRDGSKWTYQQYVGYYGKPGIARVARRGEPALDGAAGMG